MLPILLLSLRHGWLVGILSGLIVGTIQLFYGGYFLNVFQVFLDYVLSYCRNWYCRDYLHQLSHRNTTLSKASITIMSASFLGASLRFFANFLAGIICLADATLADTPVWIYFLYLQYELYTSFQTVIACILLILPL